MAELNLNQSELAKAAKLNRGTVILAMRGGDVHLSTVAAIAQALECSPLDLLQEV
jgi:DNA-binding Xre family transcriptional regulator